MGISYIQNFQELATSDTRRDALAILEAGYDAISPRHVIQTQVSVSNESLVICGQRFDLKPFKNIFLIGFGKGACAEVKEIYQILESRVKKGVVIDKTTLAVCPIEIETFAGTHPIPSPANMTATKVLWGVAEQAGADDLVLVVVSGGGSALLCASDEECDQITRLFEVASRVGATIAEMNTVRKHIPSLKGGGLAKVLYPATVIGLVFSDIVGGHPEDVASGPTYYDTSTVDDARAVLTRYGLDKEFILQETPKDRKYFEKVANFVLISNEQALRAMADKAEELGYKGVIVPEALYKSPEGVLTEIFTQAAPGRVVLGGGEVSLAVPQDHGKGGRCLQLSLEALQKLRGHDVFVAAASDGLDNSEVAGAIVDQSTVETITARNIDVTPYRKRMDSAALFEEIGGTIHTGFTESNVSDWYFLLTARIQP